MNNHHNDTTTTTTNNNNNNNDNNKKKKNNNDNNTVIIMINMNNHNNNLANHTGVCDKNTPAEKKTLSYVILGCLVSCLSCLFRKQIEIVGCRARNQGGRMGVSAAGLQGKGLNKRSCSFTGTGISIMTYAQAPY